MEVRPLGAPTSRRLEGIDTLYPVLERLADVGEGKGAVADPARLNELRRRYDVTLIPRPPMGLGSSASAAELAPTAPLIAAILAGHVDRLERYGDDYWLMLRKPVPGKTLRQALKDDPASAPALFTAALQAILALHERGVILNEGARSALQSVSGRGVVVGWHTEWATVFGRDPHSAASSKLGPSLVICATDDDGQDDEVGAAKGQQRSSAVAKPQPGGAAKELGSQQLKAQQACMAKAYPARDLLWLLSDAPPATQRLADNVVTCVVLGLRESPSLPPVALCALVPLSMLTSGDVRLPGGWQGSATPVGGTGVVVAQQDAARGPTPLLHRAAWAIQKVAASGLALHDNGSVWARSDLVDAVEELAEEARRAVDQPLQGLIVLRGIGGRQSCVVLAEAAAGEAKAAAATWERIWRPQKEGQTTAPVVVEAPPLRPEPARPSFRVSSAKEQRSGEEGARSAANELGGSQPTAAAEALTQLVREAQSGAEMEETSRSDSVELRSPASLSSLLEFFGSIDVAEEDVEAPDIEEV